MNCEVRKSPTIPLNHEKNNFHQFKNSNSCKSQAKNWLMSEARKVDIDSIRLSNIS